ARTGSRPCITLCSGHVPDHAPQAQGLHSDSAGRTRRPPGRPSQSRSVIAPRNRRLAPEPTPLTPAERLEALDSALPPDQAGAQGDAGGPPGKRPHLDLLVGLNQRRETATPRRRVRVPAGSRPLPLRAWETVAIETRLRGLPPPLGDRVGGRLA